MRPTMYFLMPEWDKGQIVNKKTSQKIDGGFHNSYPRTGF